MEFRIFRKELGVSCVTGLRYLSNVRFNTVLLDPKDLLYDIG